MLLFAATVPSSTPLSSRSFWRQYSQSFPTMTFSVAHSTATLNERSHAKIMICKIAQYIITCFILSRRQSRLGSAKLWKLPLSTPIGRSMGSRRPSDVFLFVQHNRFPTLQWGLLGCEPTEELLAISPCKADRSCCALLCWRRTPRWANICLHSSLQI